MTNVNWLVLMLTFVSTLFPTIVISFPPLNGHSLRPQLNKIVCFSSPRNCIGGVLVSVLASGAVDQYSSLGRVKPKTIKLVFVASLLTTQH